MELSCWGGDWGLPSLHPESLTVMVTGGHRPAREGGREGAAAPPPRGARLPPVGRLARLLLASGEAGGGRRDVGPAARAGLLLHGRPCRGRRALPGGAAALAGGCGTSAQHSLIPRSRIRAKKPGRNPPRTCRWLVLSASVRCLTQLLKLFFFFFLRFSYTL